MSSRIAVTAVAVASVFILLLFVALAYLWMQRVALSAELAVTTATLTDTQEDLAVTETTLQETKDVLTSTAQALEDTKVTLDGTHADLVQTRTNLNETKENLATEQEKAAALQTGLDAAKGDIDTLTQAKALLQDGNRALEHKLSEITREHGHLQALHVHQGQELDNLRQEYAELEQVNGSVAEANAKVQSLKTQIANLEQELRPLIPRVQSQRPGTFACTGSMNPAITCLDRATWLSDYRPEDVVVGTVISFESSACWTGETGRTAHRVMDIAWRGGTYYFWPKGDNNDEADGCWVPHTAVNGYIVAIQKNTNMANKPLYDGRVAAEARLDAAYNAYFAHRRAHGCYNDEAACTFYDRSAYNTAVRLNQAWRDAWDYYECWYQNAVDSEYPGHIPYRC